jgi:hypothetical protein
MVADIALAYFRSQAGVRNQDGCFFSSAASSRAMSGFSFVE